MSSSPLQKFFFGIVCFAALAFAFYLFNPIHFYFLNDDLIHIPLSRDAVLFQRKSFRPICDLSIRLDYLIWGKNAAGYHLTNLLLHGVDTVLVFFLSKSLLRVFGEAENVPLKSTMVAVLFFCYAFHSETVFWILGRSASLGALFFIPALLFYLKRHRSVSYFIFSVIFFLVALLTYESTWIFPLIILLLLSNKQSTPNFQKRFIYPAIILAIFLIYLIVRYLVIHEIAGRYEAANFLSFAPLAIIQNLVRLLLRTLTPPLQNGIYFLIAASLLVLAGLLVLFSIRKKIKKGGSISVLTILLLISFIPYLSLGIDTHSVEGERFLYLPSIFSSMLLVTLIFQFAVQLSNQLLLFSLVLAYHLMFLSKAQSYYSTASSISTITFKELNLLKNKKRLFIDSLPQSCNGALIFRLGFEEGAKWLKIPGTPDTIIISSLKVNNEGWRNDYRSSQLNVNAPHSFTSMLERDSTQQHPYITKKIPATDFNFATDAWFIFKDETLQIIK